jgi:sugar transferase (PEP-CTERM system associated)
LIRLLHAHFPGRIFFLAISEIFLVTAGFVIAIFLRLGTDEGSILLEYEQGFLKILVVLTVFIICMYYFDLYASSTISNGREIFVRMVQALGTQSVILSMFYYVYPHLRLGRGIFLLGFSVVAIMLFLWRRLFLMMNLLPQFAERTLIFGDGPLATSVSRELTTRPELGLNVVGHILETNYENDPTVVEDDDNRRKAFIAVQESLSYAVRTLRVNRIIITMGDRRGKMPVELLLSLKSRGVIIQDGPDVYEAVTGKVPVEALSLAWLLFSPGFRVSKFLLFYKRLASLIVSVVGLLLSLPLLPFVALAVKLSSPGPLLYRQKRAGCDGVVFDCYKVRTMRADAEADSGPTWASDDDPRITMVGRFLRKSRIDEIPQLWNVLRGDMSLVGPRPERPEFVEMLSREIPHYHLRHTIRPGITGWAQVRYKYGSSVEDAREKLRYDLFYVKHISPGLDLLIVSHTLKTIVWGRGAK